MPNVQTLTKPHREGINYANIYSPSKLKLYDDCQKQYYFTHIDPVYSKMKNKLKTMPQNIWKFQTVGKAVHNAITLFYYLPVEDRTRENLLLQLRLTWCSEVQWNKKPPLGKWGGFINIDEERESYKEAQQMLNNFYKICEKNPDIAFLPMKSFKKSIDDYINMIMPVGEGYEISGKFDLIINVNNSLHIIDFKTGKKEESDDFQLRFYKVLAENKFNIPVSTVSFYYLRQGTIKKFDVNNDPADKIKKEIISRINTINNNKEFSASPSKLCKYCIYRSYCPAKEEAEKILANVAQDDYPDDLPF